MSRHSQRRLEHSHWLLRHADVVFGALRLEKKKTVYEQMAPVQRKKEENKMFASGALLDGPNGGAPRLTGLPHPSGFDGLLSGALLSAAAACDLHYPALRT
ncbi:hypothetical protein EVAR_40380_1 [Eumeta japonica]|uniref:Uncharacterized protein n=1 Tax=Eumeta variegata TaxID=151549 RepID=A0A4C1XL00_EUMVA|nr:hypothetical protein EVAR_40380_1 [Eumeta japonica]